MKKLILSLLAITLFSCSAEDSTAELTKETISTLYIPDRFNGDWITTSGFSAEIKNNTISFETVKELIVRTKGTLNQDNGTTLYTADLGNKEMLVLLLNARDANTTKDDILGISLFRDNVTISSEYYLRK